MPGEIDEFGTYHLTDEDRDALARSAEDVRFGRFATEEEVEALFKKYGAKS
jgi:hypothetical protein